MSKTTIPAGGITDSAVTTAKINADAITGAKIADDAINSEHFTDGSIDTAHIADSQVTAAKTSGVGGIVEADQWRVSANESTWTSSGRHYITSDWERVDNAQFEKIGTGMSESSGVFTFPSTGKYYIRFQLDWTNREGGTNRALTYVMAEIGVTANNSSYSQFAQGNASNDDSGAEYYHSVTLTYILDVSDTSNIKTKFGAYIANPMKFLGNTGYNKTSVTFLKLGDT
jgi:hypothetical protein